MMNLVKQDEIFGSAFAAAVYISSVIKLPKDKKVYVIGMSGLEEALPPGSLRLTGIKSSKNSPLVFCRMSSVA